LTSGCEQGTLKGTATSKDLIWEAATPQERKEIYQLVFKVVYVDVMEKKLVKVVSKGAFAPLFGGSCITASQRGANPTSWGNSAA